MTNNTQPTIPLETLVNILINDIIENTDSNYVKDIPKLKAAVTEKFVSGELDYTKLDYAALRYSVIELQQTDIVHGDFDEGYYYEDDVENAIEHYKDQLTAGVDPFAIIQDIVNHENYDGLFDDYVISKTGVFLEINPLFDSPECLAWVQYMLSDIDLSQDIFLISAGKPVNVTKERVEDLIHHFEI